MLIQKMKLKQNYIFRISIIRSPKMFGSNYNNEEKYVCNNRTLTFLF